MIWPLFTKMFIAELREFLSSDGLNIDQQYFIVSNVDKVKYLSDGEEIIIFSQNPDIPINPVISDVNKLEQLLKSYIHMSLGFRFDYSNYLEAVRSSIRNILINASFKDFKDITKFVEKYTQKISCISDDYPLSSSLINVIKNKYSPRDGIVCIHNKGNYYAFNNVDRKDENLMPTAVIKDIAELEKTLKSLLAEIIKSDSLFNMHFKNFQKDEAISNTFDSIIRNVTPSDLFDLNEYFLKYKGFFEDKSFDSFKSRVQIGTLFGENLYLLCRKANADYETPYFLSFVLQSENDFVELPNVRVGIAEKYGKKTAHILALQASQDNEFIKKYRQIENKFKQLLKNSRG